MQKFIERTLDKFYKQGLSGAVHVEAKWEKAEPLYYDEEGEDRSRH